MGISFDVAELTVSELMMALPRRRSAGFTIEERDSFTTTILGSGLTDCFRRQHPGIVAYSYYGYRMNMRSKGKGWRLDYNLVSVPAPMMAFGSHGRSSARACPERMEMWACCFVLT